LHYYRARWFDAGNARFLSQDSLEFNEGVNFYRYVNNNPIKFTDPSGHQALGGACIGCAVGAAIDAGVQFYQGATTSTFNTGRAINACAAGGMAGAMMNYPAAIAAGAGGAGVAAVRTEVAVANNVARAEANVASSFFENTRYTDKVIGQIKQNDYHAFPRSADAFSSSGSVSRITGGDGISRDVLRIPGEYRGKAGFFEYMKEPNGDINHRLFVPTTRK
jgi:hypothetical protein